MSALTVEAYEAAESMAVPSHHGIGDRRSSSREALRVVRPSKARVSVPRAAAGVFSAARTSVPDRRPRAAVASVSLSPVGHRASQPASHVKARRAAQVHATAPSYARQILQLVREDLVVRTLLAVLLVVSLAAVVAGLGYAFFLSPSEVITVGAGDSLWSIASKVSDNGDIAETVAQIQNLNHLAGDNIYAGQELVIPAN